MRRSLMRVIKPVLLIAVLVSSHVQLASGQNDSRFLPRTVTVEGETYPYRVYVPVGHRQDRQWPVILWLHGAAVRGTDGVRHTSRHLAPAISQNPERFPAIVVFPQARPGHLWDAAMKAQAIAALEASTVEFNGDKNRTYAVGFSMGGRGVWSLAAKDERRFAALVVIAGPIADIPDRWTASERANALRENDYLRSNDPFAALASTIRNVPTWLFHGSADTLAPPEESRRMAQALRNVKANVRLTEYEAVPHEPDRALAEPELWSWLLAQRRGSTVPTPSK